MLQHQFAPNGIFTGIGKFNLHCNPVQKTDASGAVTPVVFPDAHLACWSVTPNTAAGITVPVQPSRTVVVTNQFFPGGEQLTTSAMVELCLPTWKSDTGAAGFPPGASSSTPPQGVDHFTCYTVQGAAPTTTVTLKDQWTIATAKPKQISVLAPVLLCLPTAKTVDPAAPGQPPTQGFNGLHLVCYTIRPGVAAGAHPNLLDMNQFGTSTVKPGSGKLLCLPSTKQIVAGI